MATNDDACPIGELRLREVAMAFRLGAATFLEDSPLSAMLAETAQHDEAILSLAAQTRPGSPPHFHLLCAVHALLLEQPGDPLAQFYATIVAAPRSPEQAYPAFRDFCLRNAGAIRFLLQHRTIQTTTPRRAGYIAPLLAQVAAEIGEPLNLIELGCSAGLLLAFDRYRLDYGQDGQLGDPRSQVVVHTELRGRRRPLQPLPRIGRRAGLDLAPVREPGPDEIRWMTGMMFPEWREQAQALTRALGIVAASRVEFIAGDALEHIGKVLAETADPVCIFHSACLYYWPEAAKQALDRALAAASHERVLHRIGVEPPAGYADRARNSAAGAAIDDNLRYPEAVRTVYADGAAHTTLLARCGRFGEWIEWL